MRTSLCLLVPLLAAAPAWSQVTPSLPTVGQAEDLVVVPQMREVVWGEDGGLWRQVVQIDEATFLKLHFVSFELPEGASLAVRSADGRLIETLVERGPKDLGDFWSLSSFGDELTLELTVREPFSVPPFEVDRVMVGSAGILDAILAPRSICALPDFEDAICYQSDQEKWSNVLASVGLMTVGGGGALWCSGSNVSADNKVLTNYHCINSQDGCDTAEFVFNFYRTGCDDGSPASTWVSYRCDQLLVSSPGGGLCDPTLEFLDFSLHSVIGDPASQFGYVVPDPTPLTDGEAIYIVQHPRGRPHEITHGDGANVDVDGTTLRYYGTLDTDNSSSGSPIFRESDDRLVGLHHCGGCSTPGVGNRGMLMSDIYPLIAPFIVTGAIFADGFESGDTLFWSETTPGFPGRPVSAAVLAPELQPRE